jgi:glycosyltransferase involved in cell wall biosynthesis
MKILFLTPQMPYPPVSGGLIKTLKMIEFLALYHEIELGFFLKENNKDSLFLLKEFKNRNTKINIFTQHLSVERGAVNFIKSLFAGLPLSLYRNRSKLFHKICDEKIHKCDVVFIDHFLMFQYLPQIKTKKVIFHEHNAEYLMWKRFGEGQTNLLTKWVLKFEAARIRSAEKAMIERADIILASPNDIEALTKISDKKNIFKETFHLGEDSLLNEPDIKFNETEKSLLYIGTLTWEANREGLYWFLKNVWPGLINEMPELKFIIIGKDNNPDFFRPWLSDSNIHWMGFVDDLRPFYSKARVFVSPLNFGSGIKVKVISALYRGIPTVTTTIGVEGLKLINGEEIFYEDTASKQIECIKLLLNQEKLWSKFAKNSRATAIARYSWPEVLKTIKEVVEND